MACRNGRRRGLVRPLSGGLAPGVSQRWLLPLLAFYAAGLIETKGNHHRCQKRLLGGGRAAKEHLLPG